MSKLRRYYRGGKGCFEAVRITTYAGRQLLTKVKQSSSAVRENS